MIRFKLYIDETMEDYILMCRAVKIGIKEGFLSTPLDSTRMVFFEDNSSYQLSRTEEGISVSRYD